MSDDPKTQSRAGGGRAADFFLSDLFYSRTDARGVIRAGNSVFQRISEFDWDELIGAPQKIIRHPDMPRAVFWLLWDALKRGEPIGAYVKNQTKSGRYYWVYAVMMPIPGGYLSVRLKPSSDLLAPVMALYADVRALEEDPNQDVSPEESAHNLIRRINDLGIPSYLAFMAKGLTAELLSADTARGKPVDDRLQVFDEMADAVNEIFTEANLLYADFRRIEQIPINLRLQASRCEAAGGPVSVISANYSNLAREALAFAAKFTDFGQDVLSEINMGLFMMGATRLQREMGLALETENGDASPVDFLRETEGLRRHQRRSGEMAQAAVVRILEKCQSFIDHSRRMRRFVGGLDVTRVTCRIETGWLPDVDGGFHDIIQKLDRFHEDVERRMKRIDALNDQIIEGANTLLNRSKTGTFRRLAVRPNTASVAVQ